MSGQGNKIQSVQYKTGKIFPMILHQMLTIHYNYVSGKASGDSTCKSYQLQFHDDTAVGRMGLSEPPANPQAQTKGWQWLGRSYSNTHRQLNDSKQHEFYLEVYPNVPCREPEREITTAQVFQDRGVNRSISNYKGKSLLWRLHSRTGSGKRMVTGWGGCSEQTAAWIRDT